MMNKIKKDKLVTVIILCAIFILTYAISSKVVPLLDDLSYSFEHTIGNLMHPDFSKRITTISQIINNQIYEYNNHNGRSLINIVVCLILMYNFGLFKIIISLMMVVFVAAVSRVATGKINNYVIFCVYAMILFMSYELKRQTIYWLTGAANYFWIIVLFVVFLIPLSDQLTERKDLKDFFKNKYLLIVWCFLSFITGWGTNIVSLFAFGFIVITLIYLAINKKLKRNAIYFVTITVFFLIGFVMLWKAPGNYVRSDYMGFSLDTIANLKYAFSLLIKISYLTNFNFVVMLAVITSLFAYKYNKKVGFATLVLFIPLIIILITRNQFLYWELPERYISLIYPDLIKKVPDYYHNVSWNLQYYFYGFYSLLFCVVYIWFFIKDKNNIFVCALFFAGFCGNLSRITIPIGSERTCIYSDLLYLIIFAKMIDTDNFFNSNKTKSILLTISLISVIYNFDTDYKIYSNDYKTYKRRVDLLKSCSLDKECSLLELPAYSPRGYYVDMNPGKLISAHTSLIAEYYGVQVTRETYTPQQD